MVSINWKIRFKNPMFIVQIILAILTPILAYVGLSFQDITSWAILGQLILQAILNPYILALVVISVWNAVNDPTTKGFSDSTNALGYSKPKED